MTLALALALQVARRVNDYAQQELTAAAYLDFVNQAIADLDAKGWRRPRSEDATTILVQDTYDYAVPSNFAWIQHIIVEDTDGKYRAENIIPHHAWYAWANSSGVPTIHFYPDAFSQLRSGAHLKFIGQRRFTTVSASDSIVPIAESFIRERAVAYAAQSLSMGSDEQAQQRARIGQAAWATSEKALQAHPMEFRVLPDSVLVEETTGGVTVRAADFFVTTATQAAIQTAIDLAVAAGGGRVEVLGGMGAITSTGIIPGSNVTLVIQPGTWLEGPADSTSVKLIDYELSSAGASHALVPALSLEGTSTVNVYTSGLVKEQVVWIGDAGGTDGQYNCIKHTWGPDPSSRYTIEFYDPFVRNYDNTDVVIPKLNILENFSFTGELRCGSNNGSTYGLYILGFKNLTIKDCKTSDFNGVNGTAGSAGALNVLGGWGLKFQGNRDLNSGSSGAAAFQLDAVSNFVFWDNAALPQGGFDIDAASEVAYGPNTIASSTNTTIVFGSDASTTDHFYEGVLQDSGTAQAGGANTITLRAGASAVNDFYTSNMLIRITGGTGAGQSKDIAAYVGATKVLTVASAWSVAPDNTSTYEIHNMLLVRVVGGTGTGQTRFISAYVGATKTATVTLAWAVNPTTQSNVMIVPLTATEEGFGALISSSHWGRCGFNYFSQGKGRGMKWQISSNISDTNTVVNNMKYLGVTAYAFAYGCRHFYCTNIVARGTQASGLWLAGLTSFVAGIADHDLNFVNCDFRNNDQSYATGGYGGAADISLSTPAYDIRFVNTQYNSFFADAKGVIIDGRLHNGAAVAAPFSNTVAETTLYTHTVTADTLSKLFGTGKELKLTVPFVYGNSSGGGDTIRVRAYFGGSLITGADYTTSAIASSGTNRNGVLEMSWIAPNRTATYLQASGRLLVGDVVSAGMYGELTGANLAQDNVFAVTVTFGTASANIGMTPHTATVRIV